MLITRIIEGIEHKIELTAEETRKAYEEQNRSYIQSDIDYALDDSEEYDKDVIFANAELTDELIDRVDSMDKSDYNEAVSVIIEMVLHEYFKK